MNDTQPFESACLNMVLSENVGYIIVYGTIQDFFYIRLRNWFQILRIENFKTIRSILLDNFSIYLSTVVFNGVCNEN